MPFYPLVSARAGAACYSHNFTAMTFLRPPGSASAIKFNVVSGAGL